VTELPEWWCRFRKAGTKPTSQYQSGLGEWFGDLASTKALGLPSAALEEHRNLLEFESLNEAVDQFA
jgi:hypothetical protein